jgi:hypothetical protein
MMNTLAASYSAAECTALGSCTALPKSEPTHSTAMDMHTNMREACSAMPNDQGIWDVQQAASIPVHTHSDVPAADHLHHHHVYHSTHLADHSHLLSGHHVGLLLALLPPLHVARRQLIRRLRLHQCTHVLVES